MDTCTSSTSLTSKEKLGPHLSTTTPHLLALRTSPRIPVTLRKHSKRFPFQKQFQRLIQHRLWISSYLNKFPSLHTVPHQEKWQNVTINYVQKRL